MKKEKLYELIVSEKHEKLEERESTIAATEDVHSKTKEQLDGAIADTSRLTLSKTQKVKHFKKQSDAYRDQFQQERVQSQSLIKEERVKMQHQIQEERVSMQHQIQEERVKMQRQIAMFQEDIRRKEEEHRAEVSGNNLFRWIFKKIKGVNSDFRNQGGQ